MKKKFYHKLGPVPTEEDLKHPKKLNPNKARNTVITWYSFVAIAIILYFVKTNIILKYNKSPKLEAEFLVNICLKRVKRKISK